MPRYRFDFVGEHAQPVYLDFPDIDKAKEEALRAMADAVMDKAAERRDPTRLATKIYDEAGCLVETVDFYDFTENRTDDDILPDDEPGVIRSG